MNQRTYKGSKRGAKPTYPWDKWFKKNKTWVLKRGVHYNCMTRTMAVLIRGQAYKRGKEVHVFRHPRGNSLKMVVGPLKE